MDALTETLKVQLLSNTAFSRVVPMLQLAWDSTSLGLFKECPRKYQLSIGMGWSPRVESVHLRFGIDYHATCAVYDGARAKGLSHDDALDQAVDYALRATWDEDLGRPWFSDHPQKNRFTLLRTVVWYLSEFGAKDPLQTVILANGKPAVELSFRMDSEYVSKNGEPFLLCGHMDRIVTAPDSRTFIADKKTTGSTISTDYFSKFSPDNQLSLYTLAGRVIYHQPIAGIIIDAAQVSVTFSRFQRGLVPRHESVIEEWHHDLGFWLAQAESCAHTGHWPMNDKACNNFGGCQFRGICAHAPSIRDEWLQASFAHRMWDPLQVRGDF